MNALSIVATFLGIIGTAYGIITAAKNSRRTSQKEDRAAGQASGTICTELGYIKGGIDDIKSEQRDQRKTTTEIVSRLAVVETSAKQAHHRIDNIEKRI